MIGSKRQMLSSTLIFSCIYVTVFGSEPNKPEEDLDLKFEISHVSALSPGVRSRDSTAVRPTHMAQLFMNYTPTVLSSGLGSGRLFETSAGQTLSKEQRAFMLSNNFSHHGYARGDEHPPDYSFFYCLYAISQDDAKKMAESFVEFMNGVANTKRHKNEKLLNKTEAEISETKKLILEKQKLAEAAKLKYQEFKKTPRYAFLTDVEAWQKAKETIVETNKTLDVIDIELVGTNEKLKTIEKYRATSGKFSKTVYEKLDQMFIEQMVDLAGAEARKGTALKIRDQEGKLVGLFDEWDHLRFQLNNLERRLSSLEQDLGHIEKELADPQMLPPEIYQNKVTIYPLLIK